MEEIVKSKMRLAKIGHPSSEPVEWVMRVSPSPSSSSAERTSLFQIINISKHTEADTLLLA